MAIQIQASKILPSQKARAPIYLILAGILASAGGLNYGYALGISGTTSLSGIENFFEFDFYKENGFCKPFDYAFYTAFTFSLYLAGLVACFAAAYITQSYGRRPSIILGGISFLIGAALTSAREQLRWTATFFLGRVMLGVGAGFGNQVVPLYLSEIAPPQLRGTLGIMFQLSVAIGCFCRESLVFAIDRIPRIYLWWLPRGLAGAPAILMIISGLLLPETPHSLIERGYYQQGRRLLRKLRGTFEVDAEYELVKEACSCAAANKTSVFRIFSERQSRPQLIMAVILPFFQQFTGSNGAVIYASLLFTETSGVRVDEGDRPVILIAGAVTVFGTLFALTNVDRWGRRVFFLEAGFQMFLSLGAMSLVKIHGYFPHADDLLMIFMCVYFCGYAWSWGPLAWLLPSEIFPLESRSAGQALAVASHMLFAFIIRMIFPFILCRFYRGSLMFFAGWVFLMTAFVYWFIPETNTVPMENMTSEVWEKHWFWKRFYKRSTS